MFTFSILTWRWMLSYERVSIGIVGVFDDKMQMAFGTQRPGMEQASPQLNAVFHTSR
jgi:hypothetical protein